MAQPFFGPITLFTKMVLIEGSPNGYGKVPNVIHANAISGATADKFRHGLWLDRVDQENAGNLPFPQTEHFQFEPSVPVRGRIFGQHHVIKSRLKEFSKLLRRQNYVCCDAEIRPPELLQAMLYFRDISVNKQDAQGESSARATVQDQGQGGFLGAIS